MNFKELKKKKESDLHKILSESRERLRELRFKDANKQLKNIREIRELRVSVAQVLTLLNVGKVKNIIKKEISEKTEVNKTEEKK